MKTFEELQERVKKLNSLLEDPQPGLMSWSMMYAEHMQWIVAYWNEN